MAKRKRPAATLTSDGVMDRLFGKGAAKKLRKVVEQEDARKGRKTKEKSDGR